MRDGWVAQEQGDETFDLFLDRYIVQYDVPSIAEVERIIKDRGGTEYTHIELDGYPVTRTV